MTLADRIAADAVREANAALREDNLRLRQRVEELEAQARGFHALKANLEAELLRRQTDLRAATGKVAQLEMKLARRETEALAARAVAGIRAA